MSDGYPESMKGRFLLAMPGLPDPNFAETVTCICEHNETGALGFIVNKIHPLLTGRELFEDLDIECDPIVDQLNVFLGGPVQPSGVFILHGPPFTWHECLRITARLGLSNSRDILEAIAKNEGPDSFLVLLGCAGWGPMQLDSELTENAWLTCPISEEIVFLEDVDMKWERSMMLVGGR